MVVSQFRGFFNMFLGRRSKKGSLPPSKAEIPKEGVEWYPDWVPKEAIEYFRNQKPVTTKRFYNYYMPNSDGTPLVFWTEEQYKGFLRGELGRFGE